MRYQRGDLTSLDLLPTREASPARHYELEGHWFSLFFSPHLGVIVFLECTTKQAKYRGWASWLPITGRWIENQLIQTHGLMMPLASEPKNDAVALKGLLTIARGATK